MLLGAAASTRKRKAAHPRNPVSERHHYEPGRSIGKEVAPHDCHTAQHRILASSVESSGFLGSTNTLLRMCCGRRMRFRSSPGRRSRIGRRGLRPSRLADAPCASLGVLPVAVECGGVGTRHSTKASGRYSKHWKFGLTDFPMFGTMSKSESRLRETRKLYQNPLLLCCPMR